MEGTPLQNTEQACKAAAHSEAFNLVTEIIKEKVIFKKLSK